MRAKMFDRANQPRIQVRLDNEVKKQLFRISTTRKMSVQVIIENLIENFIKSESVTNNKV